MSFTKIEYFLPCDNIKFRDGLQIAFIECHKTPYNMKSMTGDKNYSQGVKVSVKWQLEY